MENDGCHRRLRYIYICSMLVFLLVGKAEKVAMWDVRVYEDAASMFTG